VATKQGVKNDESRVAGAADAQDDGATGGAWLDLVFSDLEGSGYACAAIAFPSSSVGAPHIRDRLYWVANANSEDNSGRRIQRHREGDSALHGATCERFTGFCSDGSMADPNSKGLEGWSNDAPEYASQRAVRPSSPWSQLEWLTCSDGKSRPSQPGIFPLVDGISKSVVRGGDRSMAPDANQSAEARTMRLKGYGNAIVPQVAAIFITAAMQSL
jgi:DNA (cytosine-5)-methyltransferase 1